MSRQAGIDTFPVTCPFCGQDLDGLHQGTKLIIPKHDGLDEDGEERNEDERICEGSGPEVA